MKIHDLLTQAAIASQIRGENIEITGLAYDSRQVKAGDLFICLRGQKTDGHRFASGAYSSGARAFLVEEELPLPQDSTQIIVENTRHSMLKLSAAFWGYPGRKMKLVGITGTNGKTTTTYLLRSILEAAGAKVGLVGTIGNLIGARRLPSQHTTPEAPDLQELFAQMATSGLSHVVMEVSSHAIDQKRVDGQDFTVGVFTNLTQDHLDYHKTMAEYCRVKASFFSQLSHSSTAVLNLDDPYWIEMSKAAPGKVLGYSLREGELRGEILALQRDGMLLDITTPSWQERIKLSLSGSFNAANALAATGAAVALGIDKEAIVQGLSSLQGVPGRFQRIGTGEPTVIVDYAHTPDGLGNVLDTARSMPIKRLIVVFGCGGDRDKGKRPQMGRIAGERADFAIITSDNPRSEDPLTICRDVEAGLSPTGGEYIVEPDRARAIAKAISMADCGDLVLIAGKGHETYQIFRDETIHFDDGEVAARCLKERENC